ANARRSHRGAGDGAEAEVEFVGKRGIATASHAARDFGEASGPWHTGPVDRGCPPMGRARGGFTCFGHEPAERPQGEVPPGSSVQAKSKGKLSMNILDKVDAASLRDDIPDFRAGDTVEVNVKIVEGKNERIQLFKGVVIRRQGGGVRETFTVRKMSFGIGVERTFPVHSPNIDSIKVVFRGD